MNIAKVVFDDHAFSLQRHGGISRLFAEVIASAKQYGAFQADLACRVTRNRHLAEAGFFKGYILPDWLPIWRKMRQLRKLNAACLDRLIDQGADIYQQTYYDIAAAQRYAGKIPIAITVYDMIPEKHPEFLQNAKNVHAGKKEMCDIANVIFCISETTRHDLIDTYNIDPARTRLAPCGRDWQYFVRRGEYTNPPKLPQNYVLFVGAREGYKNFAVVLRAFAQVSERFSDLHLVCVGQPMRNPAELSELPEHLHRRVVITQCSDAQLYHAYKRAKAFIFPSRYEGFGIPILEAWAAEVPLLLADQPVFHEIAGEQADYFAPDDDEALAQLVIAAMDNNFWDQARRSKAKQRLQRFDIKNIQQTLGAVYQELLS